MGLYGIYGSHTQEACPLYNEESRKYLLRVAPTMAKDAVSFSFGTHIFVGSEADNPHIIEELMARTGGRFNTLKIVPSITFQTLIERCKMVEDGSFFPQTVE
jgi:hypothetical protein